MSYQHERDSFIAQMSREGLPLDVTRALLRAATTLQRYAELACSSEAADRDRVPCPAATTKQIRLRCPCRTVITDMPAAAVCPTCSGNGRVLHDVPRKATGPCLCDDYPAGSHAAGKHSTIPRIQLQADRLERRIVKLLHDTPYSQNNAMYKPWAADFQGDPRGYVLRVIPPSYAERNAGKDRFNLDTIGVPSAPSRLRF